MVLCSEPEKNDTNDTFVGKLLPERSTGVNRSTHSLQSARDGVPQFVCHAILRCQTTDVCKGFISDFQSIVLFASAVLPGANAVEKKWCPHGCLNVLPDLEFLTLEFSPISLQEAVWPCACAIFFHCSFRHIDFSNGLSSGQDSMRLVLVLML